MLIDLITTALIIAFVLIAALGHVLLTAAIYKCLREDYVDGRGQRAGARNTKAAGNDVERAGSAGGFIETARTSGS
jgi:hypothetical protein